MMIYFVVKYDLIWKTDSFKHETFWEIYESHWLPLTIRIINSDN